MKKSTKIILLLVAVLIIIGITVPICIKNYKIKNLEEKFHTSISNALEYYDEYVQTGDVKQMEKIVTELRICHKSLSEIERINDVDNSSKFIAMTISVLESSSYIKDLEYLHSGLKCYYEDMYSDAGYTSFITFVNHNTN